VKEEEQECNLNAFCGELVSVTGAIALKQAMTFEACADHNGADSVHKFWMRVEKCEHGLMDLFGGPAGDGVAAMQEHLQ
jgi:hypothetical protein